jgi:hypothetical protein
MMIGSRNRCQNDPQAMTSAWNIEPSPAYVIPQIILWIRASRWP